MKLFETAIPQMYSKGLFEEKSYDLAEEHTDKILYTAFVGAGELLNSAKSKVRATVLRFDKLNGSLAAAAIVQYFGNEQDETDPGRWNMVWTFNESDIPEGSLVITIKDTNAHSYFRAIAGDKYGIRFNDSGCIVTLLTYAFEQIYKWLDENAAEDKEVSVEMDGIFQARVAVEDGEKVFALEPMGEVKQLIKDDTQNEK